jgi:hypothetical protein
MPGYHGPQSETQKLGLKRLALLDLPVNMISVMENQAEFIGVFKNPACIMPCFLTLEYGVVYCYDSTSFGANVINMECSSKFKGVDQVK